jgi:TonB family protein
MIAQWMFYAVVVSAVLTLAAAAAERALRLWGRQARVVWCVSMVLSIAIPLVSIAQAAGLLPKIDMAAAVPKVLAPSLGSLLPPIIIGASLSPVDLAIAGGWLAMSAILALRFVALARSLARQRAGWRFATVDGQTLLVSRDAGPAVVGFRAPTVVVPDWVLGLDKTLRALVLRHEREHLERGDPRMLAAGLAGVALVPWNPALWLQLARLRAAMELDCDARVLREHPDARTYGSLLLTVAERADRGGLLAPAFIASRSLLSRRIAAMRGAKPRYRTASTTVLALAVAGLAVLSCDLRSPDEPTPPSNGPQLVPAGAAMFEFQVERPATLAWGSTQPRYPDLLRIAGVEGEVLAQFVVNPDGTVDVGTFKVLKSSHDLFTNSVRMALPNMRFEPALVGGRAVRQLVQSPFTYSIRR